MRVMILIAHLIPALYWRCGSAAALKEAGM